MQHVEQEQEQKRAPAEDRPAEAVQREIDRGVIRFPGERRVRLAPAAEAMLVGEGVMTVLSASERFALPAWALMSAHNLSEWSAPSGVRRVLIAGDRGPVGETAARRLMRRLRLEGLSASIALPPTGSDDWNAAAAEREKEGR